MEHKFSRSLFYLHSHFDREAKAQDTDWLSHASNLPPSVRCRWVSPSKVDPQVSIPRRWRDGFLLPASSRRVAGLWTLSCTWRSRNPSQRLSRAITSVQRRRGTWVCTLCWIRGSQVLKLDCWISPEVYMTSSSFPVPGSVRGTQ